jgi:hypothetical protein
MKAETDSDEEDEEELEKRSKMWFAGLHASSSSTAKEVLNIRKQLCSQIQIALEEFKAYSPPSTSITSSSLSCTLYCRISQLEYIV